MDQEEQAEVREELSRLIRKTEEMEEKLRKILDGNEKDETEQERGR